MFKRKIVQFVAACLGVFLIGAVPMVLWLSGRPRWELSASNAEKGVQIDVFKEEDALPTYSTFLEDHQVSRDVNRVTIDDLPQEVGQTTFADETIRPGRWTLILDGVEIDIMPARLVVDQKLEIVNSK